MDELNELRQKKLEQLREKIKNPQVETKIKVDDNTFEDKVIKQSNNVLVIVDFWAGWCMPCLMLGPILEKIVDEYKGKIVLAKLNVEESPRISRIYRINSIPAVKIFKNEKLVGEFIGALPEIHVREHINKHLET